MKKRLYTQYFIFILLAVSLWICTVHANVTITPPDKTVKLIPDVPIPKIPAVTSVEQFVGGLWASFYVILISELGDKTFFIAAIMSMQHNRCLVYMGAMGALISMTILSAVLGYATTVISRKLTFYASGVLFFIFGIKMLYDAYQMSPDDVKEEYAEVQMQLSQSSNDPERGDQKEQGLYQSKSRQLLKRMFSPVVAEAFILTFLAEWGDRSQITTIVLAATKSTGGVIVGGILGHSFCTGFAVLLGRFVAQKIPVKWLTVIGAFTFLFFGVATLLGNPDSNS